MSNDREEWGGKRQWEARSKGRRQGEGGGGRRANGGCGVGDEIACALKRPTICPRPSPLAPKDKGKKEERREGTRERPGDKEKQGSKRRGQARGGHERGGRSAGGERLDSMCIQSDDRPHACPCHVREVVNASHLAMHAARRCVPRLFEAISRVVASRACPVKARVTHAAHMSPRTPHKTTLPHYCLGAARNTGITLRVHAHTLTTMDVCELRHAVWVNHVCVGVCV